MNSYLAITLGPIYQTLLAARSTKALWASSYLFSWIMRETLRSLSHEKDVEILNLFGYEDNVEAFKDNLGVGIFPDRCIARLHNGVQPDLPAILRGIIGQLAAEMAKDLNDQTRIPSHTLKSRPTLGHVAQDKVQAFLQQYFRLLSLEIQLPKTDDNPVKTIDSYLTSLELQASLVPMQEIDYFGVFFEDIYYNYLVRKGFNDTDFPSTPEIATAAFREKHHDKYRPALKKLQEAHKTDDDKSQEEFLKTIADIDEKAFRQCHKYIAVVRADGDNMGNLFKSRSDAEKTVLANNLARFSLGAARKIKEYGGVAVYVGGDDLLFFAPVAALQQEFLDKWKRRHIFNLLDDLDVDFKTQVLEASGIDDTAIEAFDAIGKKPSMSYGVSLSYFKYPLGESLDFALQLLFSDIKQADKRNSIAWKVTKHSGAGFGCLFQKDSASFASFNKILRANTPDESQAGTFLSSVIFKLEALEGLFQATAQLDDWQVHFHAILFNNFNERIHRDPSDASKLSPFLEAVLGLLKALFTDKTVGKPGVQAAVYQKNVKQNLDACYAALRYVHFINSADKS